MADSKSQKIRNVIAWIVIVVGVSFYALFRVPAVSDEDDAMEPAYPAGKHFLVNIRARDIEKGDDVYFEYTFKGETHRQLNRVQAGPGDTVRLDKSNQSIWDQFEKGIDAEGRAVGKVPAGKYYVVRTNEQAAWYDSRTIGLIGRDEIIGRAVSALPF